MKVLIHTEGNNYLRVNAHWLRVLAGMGVGDAVDALERATAGEWWSATNFLPRTDPRWEQAAGMLAAGMSRPDALEYLLGYYRFKFVEVPPGAMWRVRWTSAGEVIETFTVSGDGELVLVETIK